MGPSGSIFQSEEPTDAQTDNLMAQWFHSPAQFTAHERSQTPIEAMLHELIARLEEKLAKAPTYKDLAQQWEMTINSQVEAANKTYVTLVSTYKKKQQEETKLREAFTDQMHLELSIIRRNLRDLVNAMTKNFQHEKAARKGTISKLKHEIIMLMETTFTADLR